MLGAWLLVQLHRLSAPSAIGGESSGDIARDAWSEDMHVSETDGSFAIDELWLSWLRGRTDTWAFSGTRGFATGDASKKKVDLFGRSKSLVGVAGSMSGSFQPLSMRLCFVLPVGALVFICTRGGQLDVDARREDRMEYWRSRYIGCFEKACLIGVGVSCGVPGGFGGTCRIWAYVAPLRRL